MTDQKLLLTKQGKVKFVSDAIVWMFRYSCPNSAGIIMFIVILEEAKVLQSQHLSLVGEQGEGVGTVIECELEEGEIPPDDVEEEVVLMNGGAKNGVISGPILFF